MGNKRKHDSDEEILRKIKKLEKKLSKRSRQDDETNAENTIETVAEVHALDEEVHALDEEVHALHEEVHALDEEVLDFNDELPPATSPRPDSPHQASPRQVSLGRVSPRPLSPSRSVQGSKSPAVHHDVASPSDPECPAEIELDDEILQLLGDAPRTESPLGPPIHKDVANRWQEILLKGLQKEIKDQIMQQYSVPSNCDLLLAPTLNPEVKAAIREIMIKRDSSLMYQQKQLGVALSALATAITSILSNEVSKQKILKPISDACRILCDLHFSETKTRRHFVVTSINTELKDSLVNTTRDSQLFGDNITEKIKTAKSIQRSGEALKNVPKANYTKSNLTNKTNNNKNRLNFKPQHRKNDNKPTGDAARARPPPQRPPRPGPSAPYSRPPPPPHRPRSPPKKTYR